MREKIDELPKDILDKEGRYIYESPDGGKTIYRRTMESDLNKIKNKATESHQEALKGLKTQIDYLEATIENMKRKLD